MKFYLNLIFYNSSTYSAMILGVYWHYKFFEGSGGHTDNAAESITRVQVDNMDHLIRKLKELKLEFPKKYLRLNRL